MTHGIQDDYDYNRSFEEYKSNYKTVVQTPQEVLIGKLEQQLNTIRDKVDAKHSDKKAVLQEAIEVLKGNSTKDNLRNCIDQHPKYNEAFISSKTEKLINEVLGMVEDTLKMSPK